MKQLHVREPWAGLAYKSGDQLMEDLLRRIQMLEARVRELEGREFEVAVSEENAPHRGAVPVGV